MLGECVCTSTVCICYVVCPGHFFFLFAAVSKDVLSIFFMLLLYRSLRPNSNTPLCFVCSCLGADCPSSCWDRALSVRATRPLTLRFFRGNVDEQWWQLCRFNVISSLSYDLFVTVPNVPIFQWGTLHTTLISVQTANVSLELLVTRLWGSVLF